MINPMFSLLTSELHIRHLLLVAGLEAYRVARNTDK